jgi:hypothetical protein
MTISKTSNQQEDIQGLIHVITGDNCSGKSKRSTSTYPDYCIGTDDEDVDNLPSETDEEYTSICETVKAILGIRKPFPSTKSWDTLFPLIYKLSKVPPGKSVYIENPEIFLSPPSQVRLTEYLVQKINEGVHLGVETNSEYIIYQIRISVKDEILKPDQVGISFMTEDSFHLIKVDSDGKLYKRGSGGDKLNLPKGFFDTSIKCMAKLF